ncbi:MAG: glycogen synthase [Candidatus Pacebacteria bacterium]|nr:glycogen synthase [Candidatus Paceibacterota bacterium]
MSIFSDNFKKKSKSLKILFVGSEVAPFVKVGGLGEVLHTLPRALVELGHDVRTMTPKYALICEEEFPMTKVVDGLAVPNGENNDIVCNVKKYESDDGLTNYFLENQEFYEKRGSVYGYDDDPARFALLSRGTLEFVKKISSDWTPDVIVANDWQGGLIPNYMKTEYKKDLIISKISSVFLIHNIHFQGRVDHRNTSEMDYDDGQSPIPDITDPHILKLNFMRRGIRFADVINTVSPSYAREITTPEYGESLDQLLQERRSRLFGILNGINYENYNPETNPYVEYKYDASSLKERAKNKKVLQQKFNLPENKDAFVVCIVSRLTEQKGLDLVREAIVPLLENFDFQLVVLGTGDSSYVSFFHDLDVKHKNVATHLSFDNVLPHTIYAGADAILIPSRFEPCGLTQMEAMRYGVVPIVRKIGGLGDSVTDHVSEQDPGTGFVFEHYDHNALLGTFMRAYEIFKYPKIWQGIQKRAMAENFSWEKSAKEYEKLFLRAIKQFNL